MRQERSLGDKMSEQQRAVDQIRDEQTKLRQKSSAIEQTIQQESKSTVEKFAKREKELEWRRKQIPGRGSEEARALKRERDKHH